MKYTNLKIAVRLGIGFGALLVFLVIASVLGLSRMSQIQGRLNSITNENNVQAQLATAMRVTVFERSLALRNVVLLKTAEEMRVEADRMKSGDQTYRVAERKLAGMYASLASTTPDEKALMQKIAEAERVTVPLMNKALELGLADKNDEATDVLLKEVRPQQRKWLDAMGELIAFETKLNDEAAVQAGKDYDNARMLMIAISLLAVTTGAFMAWLITRSITTPINNAVKVAQTVAAGDLTSRIEVTSTDETGHLMQALKDMNASLVNIVGQVRTGTDTIATASRQIAAGNMDLSSRTEQQASSLEETASSMEELTSTVKQNADNARQANQLAITASGIAVKGGAVVAEVVGTMGSINDSAKKIVDIISVIDGIAFQTNILALNAAVEAARAGEQGRGFAVVATEVRSLAQRSAAAAKEIKTLISDSVEKVEVGSKLVAQAGSTMDEVVESVKRVTDIMAEISAASNEQSAGIEQVNQAVSQMDQVTQQNAALVEEAAAAAGSLEDQSGHLAEVVSVFKLDSTQSLRATQGVVAPVASSRAVAKPMRALTQVTGSAHSTPRGIAPRADKASAQTTNADGWEEF
jgi:methyl-accepting chemotaxis protein